MASFTTCRAKKRCKIHNDTLEKNVLVRMCHLIRMFHANTEKTSKLDNTLSKQ